MAAPRKKRAVGAGSTALLAKLKTSAAALDMRLKGYTVPEIAVALGQPPSSIRSIIEDAVGSLESIKSERADDLRELDLARLDDLYRTAREIVDSGKMPSDRLGAIRECRGLIDQRSKLAGLNAPVTVEQRVTIADVTPPKPASAEALALLEHLRRSREVTIEGEVVDGS